MRFLASDSFAGLHRLLSACLGILITISTLQLILGLKHGWNIETDLQSLLPGDVSELQKNAEKHFSESVQNNILLLFGPGDTATLQQTANIAKELLKQQPLLTLPDVDLAADSINKKIQLYLKHRFHLLSKAQQQQLQRGEPQHVIEQAYRSLYGLSSWSKVTPLTEDPLGHFNEFFMSLKMGPDNIFSEQGNLFVTSNEQPEQKFLLLRLKLNGNAFNLSQQKVVADSIDNLVNTVGQQFPALTVLRSGVLFHAERAAANAKADVSFITSGSVIGIAVLFWLAFGSGWPLLMSILSIAFGCFCAFVLSHWIFGNVHIITLVFGASLIGVSVDYSLHFFSQVYNSQQTHNARLFMQQILPALFLGLITSVIGYGCLLQASLPGLQQIAVFSAIGLVSVWLFVATVYPFAPLPKAHNSKPLLWLVAFFYRMWQKLGAKKTQLLFGLLMLLCLLINAVWIQISHDPRALYAASPQLLAQERQIHQLLNSYSPSQFYLVTAKSGQAVLETEEALSQTLQELIAKGAISGYEISSDSLPSIKTQASNYQLLGRYFYNASDEINSAYQFMQNLGFDKDRINSEKTRYNNENGNYLTIDEWLSHSGEIEQLLWLGKQSNTEFAALIALIGVHDTSALQKAAEQFNQSIAQKNLSSATNEATVQFINKIDQLDNVLHTQFTAASLVLVLAYCAVTLLLVLFYREYQAGFMVIAPLLSTVITLTVFTLAGVPLSLFHLFALFLVLGLGMDYSIFLRESHSLDHSQSKASLLAINLSAFTSCLSFGLLSLSSTPMVQSFGMTVLCGSLLNLAIAPAIALYNKPNENLQRHKG